jgi:16S rRNA (guanine966-N2)-methyltransferase
VEESTAAKFAAPEGYTEIERRDYGESELIFLRCG